MFATFEEVMDYATDGAVSCGDDADEVNWLFLVAETGGWRGEVIGSCCGGESRDREIRSCFGSRLHLTLQCQILIVHPRQ